MKAKISALMDGELGDGEATGALDALRTDAEGRGAWGAYHLIGDAMRDARFVRVDVAARVASRLAAEPTVLAPRSFAGLRPILEQRRWQVLSAAASIAAVAFVSMAFFSQESPAPAPQVAVVQPAETVQVAPPETARDYLLAHQAYSPRVTLQGMAPYVRTVSSDVRGPRP